MSTLRTALFNFFGVSAFSVAQAEAAGFSRHRLGYSARNAEIFRVRRGVYSVVEPTANYIERIRAALMKHPRAVASHQSAAALLGLPSPWPNRWGEVVLADQHHGRRFPGTRVVRRDLGDLPIVYVDGMRCVSPVRAAVELAARLPFPAGLIVADAVGRLDAVDRAVVLDPEYRNEIRALLAAEAQRMHRHHGWRRAVRIARLADPAAESPPESMSRGLIWSMGFPDPCVGRFVRGADGRGYFADLAWEEHQLIAEVDGAMKYGDPAIHIAEKLREDAIREAGWQVSRWMASTAWTNPGQIRTKLLRKGLPCGPPRRLDSLAAPA